MKQPKKLTYEQKKVLSKEGLNWHDWKLQKETLAAYHFVKKETLCDRIPETKVILK